MPLCSSVPACPPLAVEVENWEGRNHISGLGIWQLTTAWFFPSPSLSSCSFSWDKSNCALVSGLILSTSASRRGVASMPAAAYLGKRPES